MADDQATIHLEVVSQVQQQDDRQLADRVLSQLSPGVALTRAKLRELLAVQNERLGKTLESLHQAGQVRRTSAGWERTAE